METESDTDSDSCTRERCKGSDENSSNSESESEEVWSGVLPEMLSRHIENTPPLPEARHHKTALQKVNLLLFWLLYFLLLWQATCHLSDNGLVWLLKFLISWLKVLGVEISSEVFENVLLYFPGSLYLVRQFLNLDRDDFNKFVVCPKCTKLYKYDSCLGMVDKYQRSVPTLITQEGRRWFAALPWQQK